MEFMHFLSLIYISYNVAILIFKSGGGDNSLVLFDFLDSLHPQGDDFIVSIKRLCLCYLSMAF